MSDEQKPDPVYVIETIPVGGAHEITADEIRKEGIPTPEHLRLYPELGRGAWGGSIRPPIATCYVTWRSSGSTRSSRENPFYRDGFSP